MNSTEAVGLPDRGTFSQVFHNILIILMDYGLDRFQHIPAISTKFEHVFQHIISHCDNALADRAVSVPLRPLKFLCNAILKTVYGYTVTMILPGTVLTNPGC